MNRTAAALILAVASVGAHAGTDPAAQHQADVAASTPTAADTSAAMRQMPKMMRQMQPAMQAMAREMPAMMKAMAPMMRTMADTMPQMMEAMRPMMESMEREMEPAMRDFGKDMERAGKAPRRH